MQKGFFACVILFLVINTAFASQFYACKSKYALCTTAMCTSIPGNNDVVSCQCKVMDGYSAATQQCQPVKQTKKGDVIYSRYYPIKGYTVCNNNRPWAWCLDKPCVINKKDPSKASCACSIVIDQKTYIAVPDTTCDKGIISSAGISDVNDITEFLRTQSEPKPFFPLEVYH